MDNFVKTLIEEVKSLGVFDEFRFNCCLADVDTKPAYQNVRNRVETAVKDFLAKQKWTPDTNKVQLREQLRKHLLDTDVLIKGVDQIVDQVVNPKVATIFEPKIESIAYKYMGITPPPPPANAPPPRPPPLLPAPPLPPYALGNGSSLLNVETTASLLPTDLEQISPDSDRATVKSDLKEESKDELPPGVDDDDTSPLVEPLTENKPVDSINGSLNTSDSRNKDLANDSRDAGASQVSQLSQVSSDSRLTIASSTDSAVEGNSQQPTPITPNMTVNISEEAQMPKFSENSSEASEAASIGRRLPLHFDINQDVIRFEGTERKNSLSENNNHPVEPQILSIEDAIMSEVKAVIDDANHAAIEPDAQPDPVPEEKPNPPKIDEHQAPEIVDSITNVLAEAPPTVQTNPDVAEKKEEFPQEFNQAKSEVKEEELQSASDTPEVPITDIVATPKDEAIKSSESTSSPASSSSHSKRPHSKDKDKEKEKDRRHHSQSGDKQSHRSRERDRDHSRDKSHNKHSSTSSSKHSSSHSSSSKHRSSTSSGSKSSSNRNNRESSSSKRSSSSANMSRHESSSSSQKKHKSKSSSSRSDRDREKEGSSHSHSRSHNGSSSSSNSKKSDRDRSHNKSSSSSSTAPPPTVQDDHNEAKAKIQKRRSSDSNDEGKPPGSGGPSNTSLVEDVGSKETTSTNPEPVQSGNGLTSTNGGSNGKHEEAKQSMDTNNVIIVSDLLQQSSTSFIELGATTAAQKPEKKEEISLLPTETIVTESTPKLEDLNEANEVQNEKKDLDTKLLKTLPKQMDPNENEIESEEQQIDSKQPPMEIKEEKIKLEDQQIKSQDQTELTEQKQISKDQQLMPKDEKKKPEDQQLKSEEQQSQEKQSKEEQMELEEVELKSQNPEVKTNDKQEEAETQQEDKIANHASASIPKEEILETNNTGNDLLKPNNVEVLDNKNSGSFEESDRITHFEENGEEFKERLQLISQLIEKSKQFLNELSVDLPQMLNDARALRRTTSKRRLSKEMTPIEQISPSGSSSSISSACSSPAETNPSKRLRRDGVKSSPTTSETSINSKENEALEKQEQVGLLSTRRLSQKLCQQQRYNNDDLYKPRPVLSQRSRRRGLDSIL